MTTSEPRAIAQGPTHRDLKPVGEIWYQGTVRIALLVVGLTMCALAAWTLLHGTSGVPELQAPEIGSAFAGNTLLTASEIKTGFDEAGKRFDSILAGARLTSKWANLMEWFAFGLGALVSLMAGVLGIVKEDDPASATMKKLAGARRGKWLLPLVGLIAASGTVAGSTASRLRTAKDEQIAAATEIRDAIKSARQDVLKAKSAGDARDALDQLKIVLSRP